MKILVDWSRCDGNGVCVTEAPEVFALTDEDELVLLEAEPAEALRPKVTAATLGCPKRALSVQD